MADPRSLSRILTVSLSRSRSLRRARRCLSAKPPAMSKAAAAAVRGIANAATGVGRLCVRRLLGSINMGPFGMPKGGLVVEFMVEVVFCCDSGPCAAWGLEAPDPFPEATESVGPPVVEEIPGPVFSPEPGVGLESTTPVTVVLVAVTSPADSCCAIGNFS